MQEFSHGPFSFEPRRRLQRRGEPARTWAMNYGRQTLAERTLPESTQQSDIIEAFGDARTDFVSAAVDPGEKIDLIDFITGETVAHFHSESACGMTPGLIDDRSRYWLRSAHRKLSRDVTLSEFAAIASAHASPPRAWIASLLPGGVLADDPDDWRAPTSWELRHVVGEGSFTGISGAKAAALVGVTPQNFRKYTARDGASTRQAMSFAMWHLLLHKLGVQRA